WRHATPRRVLGIQPAAASRNSEVDLSGHVSRPPAEGELRPPPGDVQPDPGPSHHLRPLRQGDATRPRSFRGASNPRIESASRAQAAFRPSTGPPGPAETAQAAASTG